MRTGTRPKRKKDLRRIAGDLLIWIGVWLVAVGLGYEAMNYPWRVLFQDWGWLPVQTDLPDPAPISADWGGAQTSGQTLSSLPQETRTLERPPAHLTMLGSIKLPRIGIAENIVEGSGAELYYATGHIPGTALPGQEGNCVIGGHRNYIPMHPFRHLDMMKTGDAIILEDQDNRYTYEIFDVLVVKPSDVWVIDPVEGESSTVTLLTCTPVVTMTDRLVVRGRLISQTPLEKKAEEASGSKADSSEGKISASGAMN